MLSMTESRPRISPRERTRRDLRTAAAALLAEGGPMTVQAVAERAGVSRATAYRHFGSNDAVALNATLPAPGDPYNDPDWAYTRPRAGDGPADRIAAVVRGMAEWAFEHERELRTILALSLQPDAVERGFARTGKTNRAHWIDAALEELPPTVSRADRRRLHAALLPLFGADAVVWTTDIAALERKQAIDQLAWTARTLVLGVLDAQ
jgi:AcrR family transcriptional regulator